MNGGPVPDRPIMPFFKGFGHCLSGRAVVTERRRKGMNARENRESKVMIDLKGFSSTKRS
jgi:hypothetical protein